MQIRVIGVPMDLGSDRRGVDMGSSAIRYAGLADAITALGHGVTDAGDIRVPGPETSDPDAREPKQGTAKFLDETAGVSRRGRRARA